MQKEKKLLILGKVWPEPKSSAAGSRMMQLIEAFEKEGWNITFASAANQSDFCETFEHSTVQTASIKMNDSVFDEFVRELNPSMVLFDRFMTEEQFGWRVVEQCPNTLRVLDMEDLHCLRHARTVVMKAGREFSKDDLFNETAIREIASMYRCDLSLVISEFEMEILTSVFKMKEELLVYLPFMLDSITDDYIKTLPTFEERNHFISIGNFLHEPNWNAVQVLKKDIWPSIRTQLPTAELHIYGAYATQKVEQLHNPKEGFIIKGRAEDAKEVLSSAKVLFAPLRIGAGLKGKLAEAMECGTPSVTSKVGAEGMAGNLEWPGAVCDEDVDFVSQAISIYTNKDEWTSSQKNGFEIINDRFNKEFHQNILMERIDNLLKDLENKRRANFIGSMLLHHSMASTKFMSRWIEEKNRDK
ncbi:MAG: glycosyltransferase [Balneolaceae bacterium]